MYKYNYRLLRCTQDEDDNDDDPYIKIIKKSSNKNWKKYRRLWDDGFGMMNMQGVEWYGVVTE